MATKLSGKIFHPGTRIELHPGMDAWMQGDRYGDVERIGRKYLHVRMDRSGRVLRVPFERVGRIIYS